MYLVLKNSKFYINYEECKFTKEMDWYVNTVCFILTMRNVNVNFIAGLVTAILVLY